MKNLSKMKKVNGFIKVLLIALGIVTSVTLSIGCAKTELKSALNFHSTPPKLTTTYQSTVLLEPSPKAKVQTKPKISAESKPVITYSTDIKPILDENCVPCHSPMGSYAGVTNEIAVGKPENSDLINAVDGGEMSGRLTSAQIKLLKEWIKQGAKK